MDTAFAERLPVGVRPFAERRGKTDTGDPDFLWIRPRGWCGDGPS